MKEGGGVKKSSGAKLLQHGKGKRDEKKKGSGTLWILERRGSGKKREGGRSDFTLTCSNKFLEISSSHRTRTGE